MSLSTLLSKPKGGKPWLCMEVNPPRGTDVSAALDRLSEVRVDFVNVTDCALAKIRLSGIVFAALAKQRFGIEPLVNLSCRDRNSIGLQSDLLGAWALGVRSVVCLTGDAVTVGDSPEAKGVFEVNSIGLLKILDTLNKGKDAVGMDLKGTPTFVPGVVVNPNVKNPAAELRRLAKKREAGGVYALSQPVFDAELAEAFFKQAQSSGVEILVGLHAFKTAQSAEALSNVPGIRVPEQLIDRVRQAPQGDVGELSLNHAMNLAERLRPYVAGFHVISGATPKLAIELTNRLEKWIKTSKPPVDALV
jgi:5,10-methylenetetrahydrofolate reductase